MNDNDRQLLDRCAAIGTSTWSDAMDACGLDGVVRGLTQRSGKGRFAAFAVTARETAGARGQFPRSAFGVGEIINAVGPGQALMVDMGGADVSTFGGLASLATATKGAAAVVIDGGCRDIDEMRECGLWLASRFVTPVTGKTRLKLESINEPVVIGGIPVRPGDIVVGDDTGIVVVPRDALDKVIAEADRMLAIDHTMQRAIEGGKPFKDAASDANYIR
jgi:regulator of RNase E activity RraA